MLINVDILIAASDNSVFRSLQSNYYISNNGLLTSSFTHVVQQSGLLRKHESS